MLIVPSRTTDFQVRGRVRHLLIVPSRTTDFRVRGRVRHVLIVPSRTTDFRVRGRVRRRTRKSVVRGNSPGKAFSVPLTEQNTDWRLSFSTWHRVPKSAQEMETYCKLPKQLRSKVQIKGFVDWVPYHLKFRIGPYELLDAVWL